MALGVAAPFNLGLLDAWLIATFPGTPLATWTFLPAGLGPALGALLARRLDNRTPRTTTLFGGDVRQNVIIGTIPILAFSLIGDSGLAYPVIALLYALGEELGWRGYLADALDGVAARFRYLITGLLWWPWHLRFETTFDLLGFPLIVLASSVVLGHAAKESNAVLVAGAMHATVILMTVNGSPSRSLAMAGTATLVGWMLVGWLFKPKSP